jgi:hypothetical protein
MAQTLTLTDDESERLYVVRDYQILDTELLESGMPAAQ